MNDAPPYSPTANSNEMGRLPHDFHIPRWNERHEDPLASLVRWKTNRSSMSSSGSTYTSGDEGPSRAYAESYPSSHDPITHVATAPAVLEAPPNYTPIDALAHVFHIEGGLVYATRTSTTPRYQLMQEFTRSGRPKKLHIRRLMASESRKSSLSDASSLNSADRLRYDEDSTMYTITTFDMRGLRSSTLGGSIQFESGGGLLGGKWVKVWHLRKTRKRNSLNPENERKIEKYGYHSRDEWDKQLLFLVKKGIWEDGEGRKVAIEDGNGFEIVDPKVKDQEGANWKRDLMVASWIMRMWRVDGIRWENDIKGW
ncbi:hypothetical protein BU24DRAFT_75788 [Aaosphaeria arxii CBS 175.79]|uniref:Uncharacterized protein n=1 Tax=Aaosphaeria arxii CBS 175.79 TaxID=1450172 RepID=A0A6A5X9R2_9PLEO|nr:uncharacterized protein BU24DRAFT_75788 [Aaosphaeria arxii CBS 175.79]KAF2009484.1 hypothetical protein BU24DRAFT_75788 [Aaosphaeria arxii CBS 175.79]